MADILQIEQFLHHLVFRKMLILSLFNILILENLASLLIEEGGINHDCIAYLHVVGLASLFTESTKHHFRFTLAALCSFQFSET